MTERTEPTTIIGSHSRLIRNPGADPTIEERIPFTEPETGGEAASVSVRCGACNKRHYDLETGRIYDREYGWYVEDGTLIVKRKCPRCGRINEGLVTASDGYPLQLAGALSGPWRCAHCGGSLGKIDPVRGRITVRCRCGQESRVFACDAIKVASGVPYEVARTLRD
jgi:phage FluMu protein Com